MLALLGARQARPGTWKALLLVVGLVGAALLYGDGAITPAISVLSAIEGLKVDAPSLGPYVVPITLVILVGLFLVQHKGVAAIGRVFGPVMLVWFVVLVLLALPSILRAPEILAAAGAKNIAASRTVLNYPGHLLGTARMGTDPARSVVDAHGRCHDVKNLFIVDGSIFVTGGAVNPTTTINYHLAQTGSVRLDVYDMAGRHVKSLVAESQLTGDHQARWNGRDEAGRSVASGTYFARLQSGGDQFVQSMVLVR